MARARNIKPSFFTNEIIGTLDPIVGMTFIGLWCLADKNGRLEDRPLRIKAELFPYREGTDLNGYLTVLEQEGFIERYEVDGARLIQVVNFDKHQSPHHTEKAKGYPPKPAAGKASKGLTVKPPLDDVKTQVPTRSDSLIPDSLIQNPPKPPKGGEPSGFAEFWSAYPKKIGKGAAEKAFAKAKVNGHLPEVLRALEAQKQTDQWQKDGGQYIPNPATWINQKRWEDEIEPPAAQTTNRFAGAIN